MWSETDFDLMLNHVADVMINTMPVAAFWFNFSENKDNYNRQLGQLLFKMVLC